MKWRIFVMRLIKKRYSALISLFFFDVFRYYILDITRQILNY